MKVSDMLHGAIDPRGDLSGVDQALVERHVRAIAALLDQDKDEFGLAKDLREYIAEHLSRDHETYIAVHHQLAQAGIISKPNFRILLSYVSEE